MRVSKKAILILSAIGLLLYFWQLNLTPPLHAGAGRAHAEDLPEDNLQFSVDGGKIYFFQPQQGRIFVYQATNGRFNYLFTLEKLGGDLKRSRSLSVIEKEQEKED